ncbi:MAG: cytochrome P450, partial [Alphaproteobacteria bacterium]
MTEAATRSMRIDDPDLLSGDPFPFYRELRARPGLWRDDEAGLWVATRLEHVVSISRDPATFCSSRGVLPSDRQRTLTPRESVLYIDPPDHGKYRKLVQPVFAPGRLRVLEAHVRDIVRGLLDAIPPGEEVEFVSAFSVPLPLVVIAEMLGVPAADRDRFKIWSDAVIEAGTRQTPENMAQAMELLGYFSEVLAR